MRPHALGRTSGACNYCWASGGGGGSSSFGPALTLRDMAHSTTPSTPNPAGLRARRTAHGLTQAQLAGRSGVSLAYVRALDVGPLPRDGEQFARVVAVLDGLDREARS